MSVEFVFAVVARDRPGLVETLSDVVTRHSGNWIDSSMARLGGEFAGIVQVSVPSESADGFAAELADLAKRGIDISLRKDETPAFAGGPRARLELTGADHPGIVHDVSAVLAKHGVSIDALETKVFKGSMSGGPMFSAVADIVFPTDLSADDLGAALEELSSDLMVEIDLSESG